MALLATYFDGLASYFINSLSETDTQNCSIFSAKFIEQIDSLIIKSKAQVENQMFQLSTFESISNHASRVEKSVKKGCRQFDSKIQNGGYVYIFLQGLQFVLKEIAEKKPNHGHTFHELVVPSKNKVNRKYLECEMTP